MKRLFAVMVFMTCAGCATPEPSARAGLAHMDTAASGERAAHIGPVNVIFDTDMCIDDDDPMALAMVHALHDRHEANLVAVTVSLDEEWCAPYVDALNTFYGHPDIPIGAIRDGLSLRVATERIRSGLGFPPREQGQSNDTAVQTFAQFVLSRRSPEGQSTYPHRLAGGSLAPAAVSLLRETLAAQPDGSVVMIQVGNSSNFAALSHSQPDAISHLSGLDLIRQKVRFLSVMAGAFKDVRVSDQLFLPSGTGINIFEDVPSANRIFRAWPTPVVVSGVEIGEAIRFPGISIEHDYSYVSHHPVAETYRYVCARHFARSDECPSVRNHHTADLTATLYALRPDRNYFSLSTPGTITVQPNGNVRFDEADNGNHYYLTIDEEQKVRAQEAMVMLVSQPSSNVLHWPEPR